MTWRSQVLSIVNDEEVAQSGLLQFIFPATSGTPTFLAMPNCLHLVECSGANAIVQLPSYLDVPVDTSLAIKRVDSSGYSVTVYPASGELINGQSSVVFNSQGEGRWFFPCKVAGIPAGPGWQAT